MNTKNETNHPVGSTCLVARLREKPKYDYDGYKSASLMDEAANRIEDLVECLDIAVEWLEQGNPDDVRTAQKIREKLSATKHLNKGNL